MRKMTLRELSEQAEAERLSPFAARSREAGRERPEEKCPIRTEYQRDRDRILHSKPFRRLTRKTQVYIAPAGDHYRTRLTHSLEVSQICRTIGRGLRLNEDLIEAIALGHDVGHTPFGHVGEEALREMLGHFEHNEQSMRIFTRLTGDGRGLNLTRATLDGILCHTGEQTPATLEGQVVKIGDRIAYLCHDYDDALRAGILSPADLPAAVRAGLGAVPARMINVLVTDMLANSADRNAVSQSPAVGELMAEFRAFMFRHVYMGKRLNLERSKGKRVVTLLFQHYMEYPELLPGHYLTWADGDRRRAVADYIAGLTDNYALQRFQELFLPSESPPSG
ncbi:MAG: deoxyguanosinetriphosphate triphosphohydrolase [Gracilibacteraceae bacterium]|jgi:dGTPase|nr:deoxyguanosinetriphosphate triphosphohydrolase [Gracilibacteraceae bacterium]